MSTGDVPSLQSWQSSVGCALQPPFSALTCLQRAVYVIQDAVTCTTVQTCIRIVNDQVCTVPTRLHAGVQMSDTSDRKQAEQARHKAALRQIEEDRRDRLEKQARMREAEVANSMAAAEASAQASDAPGEAAEQDAVGQEHLLEDATEAQQGGPLRRRRGIMPSEPSPQ